MRSCNGKETSKGESTYENRFDNRKRKERTMQSNSLKNAGTEAPWLTIHSLSQKDSVRAAALRSTVAPMKGKVQGTAGRGPSNDLMERVAVPEGGTFEAAAC